MSFSQLISHASLKGKGEKLSPVLCIVLSGCSTALNRSNHFQTLSLWISIHLLDGLWAPLGQGASLSAQHPEHLTLYNKHRSSILQNESTLKYLVAVCLLGNQLTPLNFNYLRGMVAGTQLFEAFLLSPRLHIARNLGSGAGIKSYILQQVMWLSSPIALTPILPSTFWICICICEFQYFYVSKKHFHFVFHELFEIFS